MVVDVPVMDAATVAVAVVAVVSVAVVVVVVVVVTSTTAASEHGPPEMSHGSPSTYARGLV